MYLATIIQNSSVMNMNSNRMINHYTQPLGDAYANATVCSSYSERLYF